MSLLSEVCHGVSKEPHLQPLSGETMSHHSAITENGAQLAFLCMDFGEADLTGHFCI